MIEKEFNFGELEKGTVFTKGKRWFRKCSEKNSGETIQSSGMGFATDEKGRYNFFGNNQKVKKYEFQ